MKALRKGMAGVSTRDEIQKTTIERVLVSGITSLDAYDDFWARMGHGGSATCFFVHLAQKLLAAEKTAKPGHQVDAVVGERFHSPSVRAPSFDTVAPSPQAFRVGLPWPRCCT